MDAKAEKLALFRYGLIAPLVLETLPRGELTRRAEEIARRVDGFGQSLVVVDDHELRRRSLANWQCADSSVHPVQRRAVLGSFQQFELLQRTDQSGFQLLPGVGIYAHDSWHV